MSDQSGRVQSCWICGDEHTDERHRLLLLNGAKEQVEKELAKRRAGRVQSPRHSPTPHFHEGRLAEMTPTTAAAAKRAAWQEWEWSNPWCDDCDEHHLPDQHKPSYYEEHPDV